MQLRELYEELKKRRDELGVLLSVAAGYSILNPDHLPDIECAITCYYDHHSTN